ncbi:hypothetical protein [Microbacterium sp. GCS4]|uniref:hypothetical protein n=1 Tax=Microbacterium sp. GCS4 TaxID=1692239 RepID=UPI000680AFAA|nr:hypothetical protein [Microbacterium sp. GCS4]KNY07931.1 hypothetical protein AKH00_06865 [Microbacterium sp. GCS4]
MRVIAVIAGGLLVVGGTVLVVVADQQRVDALAEAKAAVIRAQERLDEAQDRTELLAAQLTALRSTIAEQDAQIADATGFLP